MNSSEPVPADVPYNSYAPLGSPIPIAPEQRTSFIWAQVIAGALLMVATLPGRTQGLGLITEPLLKDLQLSRLTYAQINLWATLIGALACLPIGLLIDRKGPRLAAALLLPALAAVVWFMSRLPAPTPAGLIGPLFGLILLTRALGQSALSVTSISAASRVFKKDSDWPAGTYAALLSVLFMGAFGIITSVIQSSGWRPAWSGIGIALIVMMPVLCLMPGGPYQQVRDAGTDADLTLAQSLRRPLFWVYSAGIALFTAIQAGVGLFNEALLAERGFDQKTYHTFLIATAFIALVGQMLAGIGTRWMSLRYWLGLALLAQAAVLAGYSFIGNSAGLWTLAVVAGLSAGVITVAFFALWGETFGRRHLGRIMGAAQMLSVLASAVGPLLFEGGARWLGTYAKTLLAAAPVSVLLGVLTLVLRPGSVASLVPAPSTHE